MTSPEPPAVQDMDRLRVLATILAKDRAARWRYTDTLNPAELARFVQREASDPNLLADLAALLPVHRAMVLRKTQGDPEPCPLDHSCAEDESCGCWCDLHDCALDDCPTFKTVEAWIKGMQEKHEAALRRLAASTPPGAPGSPQTAERATPAETGGVEDDADYEPFVAGDGWVEEATYNVVPTTAAPPDTRTVMSERLTADMVASLESMQIERDRLAADVVQVMGERDGLLRIVASARTLLDQVARTEAVQNADEALAERADDLARRIVDEIGPVAAALWDTPITETAGEETTDADT